jgi:hypothetical protein
VFAKEVPVWAWAGQKDMQKFFASTAGMHLPTRNEELLREDKKVVGRKQTPPRVWATLLKMLPKTSNWIIDVHAGAFSLRIVYCFSLSLSWGRG